MVTLKSFGAWSMNTSLLMGTDKMILRCTYHKAFKVQLPNKREWWSRFNLDIREAWSGIRMGKKNNEYAGAGLYKWGIASVLGSTPLYSMQK
jgi:hypothetical protein